MSAPNVVSENTFKNGLTYSLSNWRIIYEDDPKWQEDFSGYLSSIKISSLLYSEEVIDSLWEGVHYLQTQVFVDSSLAGKQLGFYFKQAGASVIYLNGEKVHSIGTIFPSASNEFTYFDNVPRHINLSPGKINNISVRYSNHKAKERWEKGAWSGFQFTIGPLDEMIQSSSKQIRNLSVMEIIFIIIPATLAVIHFSLFLFNTTKKQNLFYSLFLLSFILFTYSVRQQFFENSIYTVNVFNQLAVYALLLTVYFASTSIRSIFSKSGKLDIFNFLLFLSLAVYIYIWPGVVAEILVYSFISYAFAVTGFSIFAPHSKKGTYILKTGYVLMSLSGIYQMVLITDLLPPLFNEKSIFVYGVVSFIISMSIYLAYEFIRTGEELESKIEEVKKLSKENYERELEARKKEVDQKILEADNARKTKELEDARNLQLSMLPKRIVNTEYFDIAARMDTAVEVGGDYYDTLETESGILTITLGDATGHGNKAGIMVAIIKSLFISLGSSLLLPDFLKKCSSVIRKMKLGNLFMSLIVMRTNGRDVILSSAGMPPVLHYSKEKNNVREILTKSMPLGAVKNYTYGSEEFTLQPGDVLLLFSDGIIELFNEQKEFFGLDRLITIFAQFVSQPPDEIIKNIFEEGDKWRDSHPQNDDITIMALKVK